MESERDARQYLSFSHAAAAFQLTTAARSRENLLLYLLNRASLPQVGRSKQPVSIPSQTCIIFSMVVNVLKTSKVKNRRQYFVASTQLVLAIPSTK